jgi:hypothetical protein
MFTITSHSLNMGSVLLPGKIDDEEIFSTCKVQLSYQPISWVRVKAEQYFFLKEKQ